ncbi:hypothetical protein Tco_0081410 [Tanacetum coccineum]
MIHNYRNRGKSLTYWSTFFIFDRTFSKLVTLSLNLNTEEKSGSARNEVVASEVVGVRVGVACCERGLKKGGGRGTVVNCGVHQGSNRIVSWRRIIKV